MFAEAQWLKAPAYETIVIEKLAMVFSFQNHIESSVSYFVYNWDKISLNIF